MTDAIKVLVGKYEDANKEYQTQLLNAIKIPLMVYSGRIIQNYPLGLGIRAVIKTNQLVFEAASKSGSDVYNILSTGQLNGLSIALLLSIKNVYGDTKGLDILLIDDPLQTIDDISAISLADLLTQQGTPYIYQGEEIGMTNPHYTSIEQYADVESRNYYEILLNEGKTKEEALEILAARSRDNSRTPMQWTDERYCGFSDTKPWIPVSDNFEKINVKKQKQDRDSILEFYKKLIMLRKEKEVIARGNIEFMEVENAGVLAYTRCLDKQKLLVCCNFRDVESQMEFTQEWKSGRKILGNYEENHKNNYKVLTLRPYEIIVLEKGEE